MSASIIPSVQSNYTISPPQSHPHFRFQYCSIQWRMGKLLVTLPRKSKQPYLPALENEELLVNCLQHSPINLVDIDPRLGTTCLLFWAEACHKANKQLYIRSAFSNRFLKKSNPFLRFFARIIDFCLGCGLLLWLSPIILALMFVIRRYSPEMLFISEWYVGERGKLIRGLKFYTGSEANMIPIGSWMRKYGLDNLPKLVNIIRGELSFFGYNNGQLDEAVQSSLNIQQPLVSYSGLNTSNL
ncbi:heterocyst development glycosyltransferase HepC [Richelia sinica]|nr:heterocyst development glycosyltransferase HepC [Richelia sinica]MBD2665781.1 sugar transferase [Richelia sinica FACHB-800]